MFQNNLDIIYSLYGASYVIMGIVILRQPKEGSAFKLAGILWLLAGFGLLHGINEWLNMWAILKGRNMGVDMLQWFCLTASYAFLFEFGRRTISITRQGYISSRNILTKYLHWWVILGVAAVVFLLGVSSQDLLRAGTIATRYTLGFTGSILTAYSFISYYSYEKDMLAKTNVYKVPFLLLGASFLLYSILGGLVVPEGNFFPANWLNESSFLGAAGIPVSIFRLGVAVCITIAVTEILNIFNWEAKNRLQYEILKVQALEDRHRNLLETIPDIVFNVDMDGNIIYINDAVRKLGYEPEELIGRHFSTIAASYEHVDRVLSNKIPKQIEKVIGNNPRLFNNTTPEGGNTVEVSIIKKKTDYDTSNPAEIFGEINLSNIYEVNSDTMKQEVIGSMGIIKSKDSTGATGVIRDITERRRQLDNLITLEQQMEDTARKSEEECKKLSQQLTALFEAIPDKIILLCPDFTIVWANTRTIESVNNGLNITETTQQYCYKGFLDCMFACPDCHILNCFKTGEVQDNQHTDPHGEIWDIRAVPIKNHEGRTINVIEISCDVTEKITMQQNSITSGRLASLGEISAGVAHEINNPINSIINCAQLIVDKTAENTKIHEYSNGILTEADRIAGIVRSLLSFARESKSEKIVTDISTPLMDILSMAEAQMRKDGIKLIVDLPDNLPCICANKQQLQQVFLNIISNSRYALNEKYNGSHKDKILKITCQELKIGETQHLRLKFIDYGTGIPKNILEKVKEPFFSTKPAGKGTGLGLSISHGIINDNNGRLSVESLEGYHTCVTIELPAAAKEGGCN
ncbi:MAG: PAS domain-containing protein [Nitrospirae bacterium]|nr:PAS domain-containing protein [Nitrospirota bacterium]